MLSAESWPSEQMLNIIQNTQDEESHRTPGRGEVLAFPMEHSRKGGKLSDRPSTPGLLLPLVVGRKRVSLSVLFWGSKEGEDD